MTLTHQRILRGNQQLFNTVARLQSLETRQKMPDLDLKKVDSFKGLVTVKNIPYPISRLLLKKKKNPEYIWFSPESYLIPWRVKEAAWNHKKLGSKASKIRLLCFHIPTSFWIEGAEVVILDQGSWGCQFGLTCKFPPKEAPTNTPNDVIVYTSCSRRVRVS